MSKPILPKLRIIQLFEGDFNAGLKYLIGRKLMHHMNDQGTHDVETFGSRTGKTAPEALQNLQIMFDHSRIWKIPTGIFFNDAIGCYDRIVPSLSDVAMQRKGCPKGITRCHTITQKNMVHRIRIAAGVSEGFLRFALKELIHYAGNHISFIEGRTGGVGQGGGGGPMAWIAIIDVMIETYRKMATGARAEDPINLHSLTYWLVSYVDDNTLVMSFPKSKMTGLEILEKMTKNLRTWQRLLQVTGGDIDLEKSKWCIMQWRFSTTWGVPQLESVKTFEGTIGITSPITTSGKIDKLTRMEPWEADRVLGLRLPMTGSMTKEYNYRLQQTKMLAKKLYNAPFSHQEAYQVYYTRYKPIVCYPLSVTLFNTNQCDQIQKPFIYHLLPKMGLNRHMPRAVLYGPRHLGGRELMDLRVEQRVAHWSSNLGHLRRDDRVGKGLKMTLNDHQCMVGSSFQFLSLNPTIHDYVDKNTRWYYTWLMAWELQLKVCQYDPWVPKSKVGNDRNIMDVAVQDTQLTTSKWPLLFHINCCRIYLQAFFISDLTIDGVNVPQGYLDGSKKRSHDYVTFSNDQKPAESQWKIWKAFIFRNFLGQPGYRINPQLQWNRGETIPPKERPTEAHILKDLWGMDDSLASIMQRFPTELHPIVGQVTIPPDDGLTICHGILDGTCVGASDGSLLKGFKETEGGFAYTLNNYYHDDNKVYGFGPNPKSDDMSSQTSEHYGLLGLLCVLHAICIKYKLQANECFGKVDLYIDNKNVVARGNNPAPTVNLSDFLLPDYDLWALTSNLIDALPISIECIWIKSHQDVNEYSEKIFGPFSRPVQLNIQADELANRGLQAALKEQITKPVFSTTVMGLYEYDGHEISDLRRYLLRTINGTALMDYYRSKRGWHSRVFTTIDWEALDLLLKAKRPIENNRLIQLIHNWQNTGYQKGQFRDSKLDQDAYEPTTAEKNDHLCPSGCGLSEGSLHYMTCEADTMVSHREKARGKALQKMRKSKTSDIIISYVGYILTKMSMNDDIDYYQDEFRTEEELDIFIALQGQESIGWSAMLQGIVHNGWANSQHKHMKRNGMISKKNSIKQWKRMFINTLTTYSLSTWKHRNEQIHGTTVIEGKELKMKRLREQVKVLYTKKKETTPKQRKQVYSMPLKKRLELGFHSLTLWVGMAEEVLKQNREQAAKLTIHHWIACR